MQATPAALLALVWRRRHRADCRVEQHVEFVIAAPRGLDRWGRCHPLLNPRSPMPRQIHPMSVLKAPHAVRYVQTQDCTIGGGQLKVAKGRPFASSLRPPPRTEPSERTRLLPWVLTSKRSLSSSPYTVQLMGHAGPALRPGGAGLCCNVYML